MTTAKVMTGSRTAGLIAVCVGFALVILDANVLNVAVPDLRADLHASAHALLWSVDAYTAAFATVLLSSGVMGDRWGARRVFLAGLVVFTLASIGCATAPAVGWLIAARVVQGFGAALLAPTSLALIYDMYPAGRGRVTAVSVWASSSGIAFAAGPLVGGALVESFGWPAVFWMNVPVGVVAAWLTQREIPPSPERTVRMQWPAQLCGAAALAALTGALIEVSRSGWVSATVLELGVVAVVGGACLWVAEARANAPLVPPVAFTFAPLRAGLVAGAAFNFGMYGSLFIYTIVLQTQRGFSPLLTGVAFLPLTAMHSPVATWIARPWASRSPVAPLRAGLGCTTLGSVGFVVAVDEPYWVLGVALGVFGVGSGLITTSMTSLVLANVPGDSVGVSCGLLNAARQLGAVLGVALLGSVAVRGAVAGAEWCAVAGFLLALLVVCGRAVGR